MATYSADVKTPLCTFAFTRDLFKPYEDPKSKKKKWRVTLLFSKSTDISALENAAVEAAVGEWGEKARKMIADGIIKSPFLDGDGKQGKSKESGESHPGFAGTRFIRCASGEDYRPKIVNRQVLPIVEAAELPSGSKGYGVVNAYTWENDEQGKGISFGVSMVQVAKKAEGDEVLGGGGGAGGDPDKFFEKIADEGEAPETTKGGKGAGGLFG